ncbi:hypothetical protein ABIB56_000656 [Glaciihabitans sp. UYNi722]
MGTTSGQDGAASGTQALVNVAVPIDLSGNAISVLGDSNSSDSTTAAAPAVAPAPAAAAPATTNGGDSLLGGTQGLIGLDIPVTVGGTAISVLGESSSSGSTSNQGSTDAATPADFTNASTTGDDGILGGTQIAPDDDGSAEACPKS